MAHYTTELLSIVLMWSTEGTPLNDRIDEAALKIFPPDYPIWDENYRATLNHKIIRHYLSREIGQETVGRWKLFLETRLFEIMPYYNQMYLTTLEKFDAANDVDLIIKGDNITTSHMDQQGSGTTKDKSKSLGIDYPQTTTTMDDALFYGSEGAQAEADNTGTSESTADSVGNENTTQTRKGRSGMRTQGDLIESFRKSIINIDMQVIRELKDLFFTLY